MLKYLNQGQKPAWDNFMKNTSLSVYVAWPAAIIIPGLDGLINKDKSKYRTCVKSALAIGLSAATTAGLKAAFQRPRPFVTYPNDIIQRDHAGPNSFPSGHTTSAFAAATSISLAYRKWYVTAPAFVYASLVAYSRMRLGMHYPSDVVTGIVIGTAVPFIVWKADQYFQRKKQARKAVVEP